MNQKFFKVCCTIMKVCLQIRQMTMVIQRLFNIQLKQVMSTLFVNHLVGSQVLELFAVFVLDSYHWIEKSDCISNGHLPLGKSPPVDHRLDLPSGVRNMVLKVIPWLSPGERTMVRCTDQNNLFIVNQTPMTL